jgi:hypothetical protein
MNKCNNLPDEARQRGLEQCKAANKRKRTERIEAYELNPTKCQHCGTALPYNKRQGKFCNHSCAAQFNNLGVQRNFAKVKLRTEKRPRTRGRPLLRQSPTRLCEVCHDPIKNRNVRFCSIKCRRACLPTFEDLEKLDVLPHNDRWLCGRRTRRYLIASRGHRCERCGNTKWLGQPIPLSMDHIDGDPTNWHRDNLRLLCANCDRLNPTFAGRNKKNSQGGRAIRRARYQAGQTY